MSFSRPDDIKAPNEGIEISWDNADGGYGIFTGVNSVTDTVTVRVQTSPF